MTDHSVGGTSETPSDVPGLNQIGAMLDDLGKNILQNQKWALQDWVLGAKLLVIVTDIHGLRGDDYVQFAVAHLPICGEKPGKKSRATVYQPVKMPTSRPSRSRTRKSIRRLILWHRYSRRTRHSVPNSTPHGRASGQSGRHARKCKMCCTRCGLTSRGC